jgi:hypothetical protein
MGLRIDGATAIGYAGKDDAESPYSADEGRDYRRLLDDLNDAGGYCDRGRDAHHGRISPILDERRIGRAIFASATSPAFRLPVAGVPTRCAMTNVPLHRHYRKRLLVAVALLGYLALLVVWQIDTLRRAPLEPLSVFILGVILGAMTAVGFVVRQRWRLYLASRA